MTPATGCRRPISVVIDLGDAATRIVLNFAYGAEVHSAIRNPSVTVITPAAAAPAVPWTCTTTWSEESA